MKLYIDDIREAPKGWTLARTVGQAIKLIEMFGKEIDEFSFDHDISHQVKVGKVSRPYPCDECFCAVARYAVAYYDHCYYNEEVKDEIKTTIHTANPSGAGDLKTILVGFEPEYVPCPPCNRLEDDK